MPATDVIQFIPPPDIIRREISARVREAEFLRRLLRLAEQRERLKRPETVAASSGA